MNVRCFVTSLLVLTTVGAIACDKRSRRGSEETDLPQRVMDPAKEKLCNEVFKKNLRGKRISWKGKLPILFLFDAGFPAGFVPSVKSAAATWNQAAGFELFRIVSEVRPSSKPAHDGINTLYFMKAGADLKLENDLAVTIVNGRANQITDTDIIFNSDKEFSASSFHPGSFDMERTALHELGHVLGLVDNKDSSSTMYFGDSSTGFPNRVLDDTAKQSLVCEYP